MTENYVQKKNLPPTVDLSEYAKLTNLNEYRKKDDLLSYTDGTITKNVEFTKTANQYSFYSVYFDSAHFILKYENNTYEFDFTIDNQSDYIYINYDHIINENLTLRWSVNKLNKSIITLLDSNEIMLKLELLSITYQAPDELALKSQIEKLKKENTELKTTIALLEKVFWIDRTFTHLTPNGDNYVKLGDWFDISNFAKSIKQFRMTGYYLDKNANKTYFDFIYEDDIDENSENYSYVYEGNQTVKMYFEGNELWIMELVNGEWIDRKTYFTALKQKN